MSSSQEVQRMLETHIRPDKSEEDEEKRSLIDEAVALATEDVLGAFLHVNYTLIERVGDDRVRTRAVLRTKTNGIGLLYNTGIGKRPKEIQTVLLPTKPQWKGQIEAYLRGHRCSPITAPTSVNEPTGETVYGKPVFQVIGMPSQELVEQIIRAFTESSLSVRRTDDGLAL